MNNTFIITKKNKYKKHNKVNIIIRYAYCYTCRYFNGDFYSDKEFSLSCLLTLSIVLDIPNVRPKKTNNDNKWNIYYEMLTLSNTFEDALHLLLLRTDESSFKQTKAFSISIFKDVSYLCFREASAVMLFDILYLFHSVIKTCEDFALKKLFRLSKKKVEFFASLVLGSEFDMHTMIGLQNSKEKFKNCNTEESRSAKMASKSEQFALDFTKLTRDKSPGCAVLDVQLYSLLRILFYLIII
jgi:hypothetical protein